MQSSVGKALHVNGNVLNCLCVISSTSQSGFLYLDATGNNYKNAISDPPSSVRSQGIIIATHPCLLFTAAAYNWCARRVLQYGDSDLPPMSMATQHGHLRLDGGDESGYDGAADPVQHCILLAVLHKLNLHLVSAAQC